MAEDLADVRGPQWSGRLVEHREDASVVRMPGQFRWGCGEPVGQAGDSLAGDREVLEVCLRLPQPALQVLDLCAEVVGQVQGGVFLEVQAGCSRGHRRFAPGGSVRAGEGRNITWVIAQ
ncbi:hypothetical protein Shyhy02_71920 [Streptomyces hygroscopicus subsp. hygroscopicus]|nr:hypothetical protein Shyhy02_71920 [Streptomyces hygroscopicus subsp. hygroscopicus]